MTRSESAELRDQIASATKEAMKAKDAVRLSTLRLVSAAIKDRDIEARSSDRCNGIDSAEILSLLSKMVKQRQESAKTYEEGGRLELAEREREEIGVIREFMPAPLSEEDLRAAIRDRIEECEGPCLKDMGKIMNSLRAEYAGRIDMGKAGGLVKQFLCEAKQEQKTAEITEAVKQPAKSRGFSL